MLAKKLQEAAGNSADATLYVDDVFSTWLYAGTSNSSSGAQTITNNIDLAGKGGLVWIKNRTTAYVHNLQDTVRGAGNRLRSSSTGAQNYNAEYITSFNSDGFSVGLDAGINQNTDAICSWTFRKAAKFFDVVTYTGTGSARTIAHSLGIAPGMIIVKRTDTSSDWQVYSNGMTSAAYSMQLNLTDAQASAPTVWNSTAPTSSVFSVGTSADVNASGGTYVAYLFAHDTSSTGIIQCGSFIGSSTVNLGWEPQYLLFRMSSTLDDWFVVDTMRGFSQTYGGVLKPNSSAVEYNYSGSGLNPTASGFTSNGIFSPGETVIYMAIRRPNKPPTTGTQVFAPVAITSSGTTTVTTGFSVDLTLQALTGTASSKPVVDRLRGGGPFMWSNLTNAESDQNPYGAAFDNNTAVIWKYTTGGYPMVLQNFRRAAGFFDEVCYTGTGVATTQAHNLAAVPELMIIKSRSNGTIRWVVYDKSLSTNANLNYLYLNEVDEKQVDAGVMWNSTAPTSSVFSIGVGQTNVATLTYVAYLFATLAGISKVGSYTGNGTGQAIACGFSAGARFVLIKRTDAAGDWYTFDSARGLTSGSSPYLLLNSTAAEVTGNNGVYASSGGFTLGATASTTTNISGASYIFLAVA